MADLVTKAYYYQSNVNLNQVTINEDHLASSYLGKRNYVYANTGSVVNANAPPTDYGYLDLQIVLAETGT